MIVNSLEESIDDVGEDIVDVALVLVRVVDKTIKRRKFLADKYIVIFEDLKEKQTFRRRVDPVEYLDFKVGQRYTLKLPLFFRSFSSRDGPFVTNSDHGPFV